MMVYECRYLNKYTFKIVENKSAPWISYADILQIVNVDDNKIIDTLLDEEEKDTTIIEGRDNTVAPVISTIISIRGLEKICNNASNYNEAKIFFNFAVENFFAPIQQHLFNQLINERSKLFKKLIIHNILNDILEKANSGELKETIIGELDNKDESFDCEGHYEAVERETISNMMTILNLLENSADIKIIRSN